MQTKIKMIEKDRIAYWDNLKAILILLVVFGHFMFELESQSIWFDYLFDFVYMFHMPAFIFVSGYFSTSEHSRSGRTITRLLCAYLLFNTLFLICDAITGKTLNFAQPYYSCWYLLALIVWRISIPYISKYKAALPVTIVIALFIGFCDDISNILAMKRIVAFYPFFLAGYLYNKNNQYVHLQTKYIKRLVTGAGLLLLGFVIALIWEKTYHYTNAQLLMEPYGQFSWEYPIVRLSLFMIATLLLFGLLEIVPNRNLPVLTKIGKNSLSVFLFHRIFVLMLATPLRNTGSIKLMLSASCLLTVVLAVFFGTNFISGILNEILDFGADLISTNKIRGKYKWKTVVYSAIYIAAALSIFSSPFISYYSKKVPKSADDKYVYSDTNETEYVKISANKKNQFENAFKIVFAGDLILLEDQVKNAYNGDGYDFSEMFEYTKEYISDADLAIGVYEGPSGGEEIGYSSSNYDDGKKLQLNFPDEFAVCIKDAGFDLVTTANNHLLDKGVWAAKRTLDVLDQAGLQHIGSYRSDEEKENERIKIIDKNGLRIAVLAYTYGTNYYSSSDLLGGNMKYITSLLAAPDSEHFESVKQSVADDFAAAKEYDPDIILVLPHMGEQFADYPNEYQETWCKIFYENGADIVLGDHTHSVQPIVMDNYGGTTHLKAYCPGNYANIYREHNGDASALIEVYISKETKSVVGGAIIPMWTEAQINGNYRPLPIFDILEKPELRSSLSTYDLDRIEEVQKHITKIMLGKELGLNLVRNRYYFDETGILRESVPPLELTAEMQQSDFYKLYAEAESVCFVGDSLTEGTKNGGYAWYEPIESYAGGKVYNRGWGSITSKLLLEKIDTIKETSAELYVIAIGTNDVRYRDPQICAMSAEEYISNLNALCVELKLGNPNAKFVFIAPWTSTDGDKMSQLEFSEKISLNNEYTEKLKEFCENEGYLFINANKQIDQILTKNVSYDYLIDYIHPNSTKGIELYSASVLCN